MHAILIHGLLCVIWDLTQAYVARDFYTESSPQPSLATLRLVRVCYLEHNFDYQQIKDKVKGRKGEPKKVPSEATMSHYP